jgi:2-polyprenyl-3-methyl-5-hydroxy-6-metoxy-1,4-benzoquinol methylase
MVIPGDHRNQRDNHEFEVKEIAMQAERVQEFAGKMFGVLNGAMLALMTSIGRQTGLFETMATLSPSSSDEIARATGLHERYVREWLGAMVTGGIIAYDPQAHTYALPREHVALLTNAAGPRNLARYTQFVPMLAEVEADVIDCFRHGGGVPYSKYPRFQALMAESSALRFDHLLLDKMVPLTGMQEALTGGIAVLDVGCGQGHAVNLLAQAFPQSRFTGYDMSEGGIATARAEAQTLGNTNVHFAVRDVSALNESGRYDLITACDAIHDQAHPAAVLRGVAEALTPQGTFLMQDIGASSQLQDNMVNPFAPFLYALSTMHCMTVSLALDGAGLGTVWGQQQALAMLGEAGFTRVDVHRLEGDPLNNYYVARKA